MLPARDATRAAACVGPGHADRGTTAILARHAVLFAAGDEWGSVNMVDLKLPTSAAEPESCGTCRFRVTTGSRTVPDHRTERFVEVGEHECRAEPPRPKSPFPWTSLDRWCGFWEPVPAAEAGEPSHYAATRAARD